MADGLVVGGVYRDKRGLEWRVRGFLYKDGVWFVEDPKGDYVDVVPVGSHRGKFIRRSTFAKNLATEASR